MSFIQGGEVLMAAILVVDDERDPCTMMFRILSAKGHEVITCTDGHEAMVWLERRKPDLRVVNLKLQSLDGMFLLRLTREHDPQTNVVILMVYPSAETASEALPSGFAKYLIKPIEIGDLETNVEEVLSSIS